MFLAIQFQHKLDAHGLCCWLKELARCLKHLVSCTISRMPELTSYGYAVQFPFLELPFLVGKSAHYFCFALFSVMCLCRAVLAFRRWLQEKAGGDVGWVGGATSKDLPAKLSRKEVLNRWERHGKNCADCTQVVCQHCFWGLNGPTWTFLCLSVNASPPHLPHAPAP